MIPLFVVVPTTFVTHSYFISTQQITTPPPFPPTTSGTTVISSTSHTPIMATRYAPLVLQKPLNSMPINYAQWIPQFDGTRPITTHQHIDKMNDFSHLEEVYDDDVQVIFFLNIWQVKWENGTEDWKQVVFIIYSNFIKFSFLVGRLKRINFNFSQNTKV